MTRKTFQNGNNLIHTTTGKLCFKDEKIFQSSSIKYNVHCIGRYNGYTTRT